MSTDVEELPIPTKNVMELEEAVPDFAGQEWAEVIQDGNSRRHLVARKHSPEFTGNPKTVTPPDGDDSESIANTEFVKRALDNLNLNPDAPGEPVNLTMTTRTTLDQDGKVAIFVILDWDAPTPSKPAWTFEVRYTKDGADPDSKIVGEPGAKIRVESGVAYQFKVRTLSKDDKSDYVLFDPITPLKKMIAPPAPSGLARANGHRRVKLKWDNPLIANPTFYDYWKTVIYRAPNNNFANAVEIDRTDGTYYVDDGLNNGDTWFYWITHLDTSRNESAKHPTSNTAGVQGQPVKITDDDQDDTPPGIPQSLLLTPRTVLTTDGRLMLDLIATWNAPSGGLSAKGSYVIWIRDTTTGDIDTKNTDRDDRSVTFRVKANRTYEVKVRAKNGNGQAGTYTGIVTAVMDSKTSYAVTPSGLTADGFHRRVVLSWDEITGTDALDYKHTRVYRATTNNFAAAMIVGRPNGTEFVDGGLANGQQYWYWIAHVDNSKNVSARFPLAPATNNGITATTQTVKRADLDGLAVDTDQMELNSVTGLVSFGANMKAVAHNPTTASPGASFGWGGNSSGTKYTFNVVVGESGPVKNLNPGPVTIIGSMSLVQDCQDEGFDGVFSAAGKSEVKTALVLEYRRAGGSWKAVPKSKGPSCRESAGRDDDMHKQKDNASVNIIHKPSDANTYFYRVRLTGYHRRGNGRQWSKADILAGFSLKMQFTKR